MLRLDRSSELSLHAVSIRWAHICDQRKQEGKVGRRNAPSSFSLL